MIETITWHRADQALPDADETVLICYQDGDHPETFVGWYDADMWRDASGVPVWRVLAWASLPAGVSL
jgi:hypothetical protein